MIDMQFEGTLYRAEGATPCQPDIIEKLDYKQCLFFKTPNAISPALVIAGEKGEDGKRRLLFLNYLNEPGGAIIDVKFHPLESTVDYEHTNLLHPVEEPARDDMKDTEWGVDTVEKFLP
ncbi:hypothetical protein ACFLZX_02445 [Nanoarchaeota archaeon]